MRLTSTQKLFRLRILKLAISFFILGPVWFMKVVDEKKKLRSQFQNRSKRKEFFLCLLVSKKRKCITK